MRKGTFRPLVFSVPKEEGQRNEDSYQISSKGFYALSDGASISFDSASWARILVRRFAQNPDFSLEWLSAAIAEFGKLYDRETLPWMKQASFDRGSFASLLGVRFLEHGKLIQLLGIGDSLAVLCDHDRVVASFPYSDASQFDAAPQLLSTNPVDNAFLTKVDLSELNVDLTFSGREQPALLCMTDALGRWLLSSREAGPSPIAVLRSLRTPIAFARFVLTERACGRLRRDDTTLLAIW